MEQNFQPRMKRKDYEDSRDDFADFGFSSPATKIRRLDAEYPPLVVVDEEPEVAAAAFEQSQEQSFHNSGGLRIEELPNLEENEERAIVLFNPSTAANIAQSPSSFSVSLDPRFISGLKNKVLRPGQQNSWSWRVANEDEAAEKEDDDSSTSSNGCQAVVPWLPPRFPSTNGDGSHQFDSNEMIDDEEMGEAAAMDVEDSTSIQQSNTTEGGGSMLFNHGLPQWQQQQQHCTILQPPQNTTTPIVWYR